MSVLIVYNLKKKNNTTNKIVLQMYTLFLPGKSLV